MFLQRQPVGPVKLGLAGPENGAAVHAKRRLPLEHQRPQLKAANKMDLPHKPFSRALDDAIVYALKVINRRRRPGKESRPRSLLGPLAGVLASICRRRARV